MGFFRRRGAAQQDEPRTTIEDVSDDNNAQASISRPVVEEPDEQGKSSGVPQGNPSQQTAEMDYGGFNVFPPFPFEVFNHPFFGGQRSAVPSASNAAHQSFHEIPFPSLFDQSFEDFLQPSSAFMPVPSIPRWQQHSTGNHSDPPQKVRNTIPPEQFQYSCQSWTSVQSPSGQRVDHHYSARGSSDDSLHHVHESVRDRHGQVYTRQESSPFRQGRRQKLLSGKHHSASEE